MSHDYSLIIYTSPAEGREDDYNAWYDDVHLAEFTALPGVLSGRRFQVAASASGQPQYCAIYELSCPPDEVMAAMNASIKDGSMHMSDAIDAKSAQIITLESR